MARKSRKNAVISEKPKKSDSKVWQAALYIRLSVEFNSKRGDSLETQRQIMEAYLALCPDIEIKEIYTDNGISGRTFEREAFQRMLTDVENGKIDCIVVKDLSRLGRNTIDTGYYIEKYFPLHGVRFIAVNDQFDSEDSENSGSHLIVPLKNMVNEAYAADIGKKVRAQQRQAIKDGELVGGHPPFGYKKNPDNCHHLLVNEDTAPIVRQIFQWRVNGVPLDVIVKRLNEEGVMTPGFYLAEMGLTTSKNLIGSGKWQTRTIRRILTNQIYTGDMVQGKHTNIGYKQFSTKPEDWIVVQGTHEPIISRELFAKAQAVQEAVSEKVKTHAAKVPYTENILRGRVFCGCCGKPLHRQRHKCGYYTYRCIANDRIGKGACNAKTYVRESDLFSTIVAIIRQKAEIVMGESLRLNQCDSKIAAQKVNVDKEISELQRQTAKNKDLRAGLYESHIKGILTRAEYLEMREDYNRKISDAVERVQQLQMQQSELERQMKHYTSMADKLAAVDKDTALSSLLVSQLIKRITVNDSNDISIEFTFGSDFGQVMEVLTDE